MPGFPAGLAAIGAGLGQFAQQYQQQQAQRERSQILALQMQAFQQQMQERKRQLDASNAAAGFALGGGGLGDASVSPIGGGGLPGSAPMPQAATAAPAPDMGGGMRAGGALTGDPASLVRKYESSDNYNVGVGGSDLSKAPLDDSGFPQWAGKMGPQGISHAAGGYQFQPGTWRPAAQRLGIHDFSPASQDAVFNEVSGGGKDLSPWLPYNPKLAAAVKQGGGDAQPSAAAPQTAQTALPGGVTAPPPQQIDFGRIVRTIKQQHPEFDNATLIEAANLAQQNLGPQYKQAWERWKTMTDFGLRQTSQAETGRHNLADEGFAGQRIAGEGVARAETGRHNLATEQLGQGQLAETTRAHDLSAQGASNRLQAQVGKQQQQTQLATTQMKTLADRARRLYQAVEENPNLVGVRGFGQRMLGSVGEQLGVTHEDPAVADFKSQVQLLQAQLQKPLLGARYFSGKAQEQMSALVPALARLDNPTAVKSALRNLAEVLEGTAESTEAATRGVTSDFSHISDEELMRQLGAQPQQ